MQLLKIKAALHLCLGYSVWGAASVLMLYQTILSKRCTTNVLYSNLGSWKDCTESLPALNAGLGLSCPLQKKISLQQGPAININKGNNMRGEKDA